VAVPGVDALTQVAPEQAAVLLSGAAVTGLAEVREVTAGGSQVGESWSWTDGNGRNLLVTAARSTGRDGPRSLYVLHLAGLDDAPRALRVMREPDVPRCPRPGAGDAGFTPGSITVADADADGSAEVTVGWAYRCAQDRRSTAKLALLVDGKKFIVRGDGAVGEPGAGRTVPDPSPQEWPRRYLDTVTDLYRTLYF
jgi:hypothetical protein